jgi:hypothetical protein
MITDEEARNFARDQIANPSFWIGTAFGLLIALVVSLVA